MSSFTLISDLVPKGDQPNAIKVLSNKILSGIQKACQKRPVSIESMENLVEKIEQHIQDSGDKEVKSSVIGEKVMQGLYDLDEVAYVRFASVYRQFKDISEFMAEVKELLSNKGKEEEFKDRKEYHNPLERKGGDK